MNFNYSSLFLCVPGVLCRCFCFQNQQIYILIGLFYSDLIIWANLASSPATVRSAEIARLA